MAVPTYTYLTSFLKKGEYVCMLVISPLKLCTPYGAYRWGLKEIFPPMVCDNPVQPYCTNYGNNVTLWHP